MDIQKADIKELKAMVYDRLILIENIQKELNLLNLEIQSRNTPPQATEAATPKENRVSAVPPDEA